ncbi:hypothetical protein HU751_022025 [Pseudomonas sp. BW13M1]|jgi:hypothetical protein|uniref:HNH endonuclease n=1 Tax=Pseudomonas peradeniyensis TaxID=2745488 RepID=A0A923G8D2_9PSED|nr:HNH endonuclease [Pseudomonas peradeniyensis]MBV4507515.1 hypothetical protein [Pseudomonas peradeniyensis]
MTTFAYTIDEHLSIARALQVGTRPRPSAREIWESAHVAPIKQRLKAHKRREQGERCCYCQRPIGGEYNMVLDIEHVLPKSQFNHCIFDLPNLAVACAKCNRKVKRARLDFIDPALLRIPRMHKSLLFNPDYYRIAHPNLTDAYKHLTINVHLVGRSTLFHYDLLTPMGKYMYDFFELHEFESESISHAQGIPAPVNEDLHEQIKALEREIYG